jgi:hypothetical protein
MREQNRPTHTENGSSKTGQPGAPVRVKLLSCEIFFREVCRLVSASPNTCDVEFLPKGLHDLGTENMRTRLQECIDGVPANTYQAILLGYGLCNNGTAGLAARHTPLVVPRAHDCITLFMGCRSRYSRYASEHPGTYYRTTGWYERDDASGAGSPTVSQKLGLSVKYDELVAQYGEENAAYIMETLGDPTANYDRLTFIKMGVADEQPFLDMAQTEAREKGWTFDPIQGSMELFEKLIDGPWDDDFVIVPPGARIVPRYDHEVLGTASDRSDEERRT